MANGYKNSLNIKKEKICHIMNYLELSCNEKSNMVLLFSEIKKKIYVNYKRGSEEKNGTKSACNPF